MGTLPTLDAQEGCARGNYLAIDLQLICQRIYLALEDTGASAIGTDTKASTQALRHVYELRKDQVGNRHVHRHLQNHHIITTQVHHLRQPATVSDLLAVHVGTRFDHAPIVGKLDALDGAICALCFDHCVHDETPALDFFQRI